MRNFKKTFVSLVLSGACALSLTASACSNGSTTGGDPADTEHEHTYSDEWVYNSTQHWHPASCDDTNTVSDQANHVDENGDLVCDVCGWNYPHEHTFDNDWAANAEGHYHPSTCGHDVTSEVEAHTPDIMGVCAVCGYQVSEPDTSTIADALEIAQYNQSLVMLSQGTQESYYCFWELGYDENDQPIQIDRVRQTTTEIETQYSDNFTYISQVSEGTYNATIETWNTAMENGSVFSVVDNHDGSGVVINPYDVSAENMGGYDFTSPIDAAEHYFGITNLVAGIYENASYNGYIVSEYVPGDVITPATDTEEAVVSQNYQFNIEYYVEGYVGGEEGEDTVRNQDGDILHTISVEFSLSDNYYIDSATISVYEYGSQGLTFPSGDENAHGTVTPDTPYYTSEITTFTQSNSTSPYDPDQVLLTDFEVADAEGNVISGGEDAPTIELAPGSSNSFTLTEIAPSTADLSLDRITAQLYQYDYELNRYEEAQTGWTTMNINAYSDGTVNINPAFGVALGTIFRIVLSSTNASTVINVEIAYPAPTSISATANGTSTDTYNLYTGVNLTIGGSVTYGFDPGFTAAITSDNAADATLINNVFSTDTPGTYEVTVTSSADTSVSDTISIVVSPAPEISEVLVGNYVYNVENDYTGYYAQNVYIGFAPATEGGLSGTFSYYIVTAYYGEFIGSCEYSYNEETGVTLTGLPEDTDLTVAVADDYTPEISFVIENNYGNETLTVNGFETTTEEVPDELLIDIPSEIEWMTFYNSTLDVGIYFEEGGTGAIFEGTDQWFTDIVATITWVLDENDHIVMTLAEGVTLPAELEEAAAIIFTEEGATFDAESDSVVLGEYEFSEPSSWGW